MKIKSEFLNKSNHILAARSVNLKSLRKQKLKCTAKRLSTYASVLLWLEVDILPVCVCVCVCNIGDVARQKLEFMRAESDTRVPCSSRNRNEKFPGYPDLLRYFR